jgi:flagellar motor switch protein FliM
MSMDAPETTQVAPTDDSSSAPVALEQEATSTPAPSLQRFDFRHPVFLSSAEWRKLRIEIDEFIEATGAVLSTYLRLDLGVQLGKLHTLTFGEFTSALPSPTHLTLFKTDPLRGISVIEVQSGIGQAIVDRLLGGPGKGSGADRNLTEMEIALMDQFVRLVMDEWCQMWRKLQELRPEILGHENNAKFLQCASNDTLMLGVTLDLRMGESEGHIQLVFPYVPLEPLINKLAQLGAAPATPQAAAMTPPTKWTQNLEKVPLTMQAFWPAMKVPTRKLLALQVGSMLDLKSEDSERIELRLGKVVKFRGRLGTREDKWAVQITEVSKV